jgi:hypothetical protein
MERRSRNAIQGLVLATLGCACICGAFSWFRNPSQIWVFTTTGVIAGWFGLYAGLGLNCGGFLGGPFLLLLGLLWPAHTQSPIFVQYLQPALIGLGVGVFLGWYEWQKSDWNDVKPSDQSQQAPPTPH